MPAPAVAAAAPGIIKAIAPTVVSNLMKRRQQKMAEEEEPEEEQMEEPQEESLTSVIASTAVPAVASMLNAKA